MLSHSDFCFPEEMIGLDVTSGFGRKWKNLFQTLEARDGLDVNSDAHLWLLHFLFIPMINNDAGQWAAAWNSHVLSRRLIETDSNGEEGGWI